MNVAQLDGRIADVKRVLADHSVARAALEAKGLPVEQTEKIIVILRCCLAIIEASGRVDEEAPLALPRPSVLDSLAA